MSRRRRSSYSSLALKSAELAFAAPQVVAHRLARMSVAGASPSARDRREFERMHTEKTSAFAESWLAMASATMLAQQAMAMSAVQSFWSAPLGGRRHGQAARRRARQSALDIMSRGLAPVHRTAVANARRLARGKIR
jgi:hypothetical protein